jgi:hypothetical protein
MRHSPIIVCAVTLALILGGAASAQQFIPPGASQFNPPPPPPPPPPKMDVPVVPKMDAPIRQDYAPAPQPSFSDRINSCLDQAAAAGLGPGERAAYSRACANR